MNRRIAVLRGGLSEEFSLSMQNGAEIIDILQTQGDNTVVEVVVAKSGEWLIDGLVRTPEAALQHIDLAYIALHGVYGEDGSVQRVLERYGVPYIGSQPFPSSVALHKALTKETLNRSQLKTAPHLRATREGVGDVQAFARMVSSLFGPEYILKPMRGGSSIGNQKAESSVQLANALSEMFESYDDILIEQFIPGVDATCGVVENLRGQDLYLTPITEIVYSNEQEDIFLAEKIAPGRFSQSQKDEMAAMAATVHTTLGLKDLSRSDFRVTPAGDIYFLEVNTLPAATANSPLVSGLNALGVEQTELVSHLFATQ